MDDYEPAPTELVDDDVWSGVEATGDYVGQRAAGLEMGGVMVRKGRWTGVTLEGVRAFDTVFEDCDLADFLVEEEPTLQLVTFRRCRMTGATFSGARLRDVTFEGCTLENSNFRMIDGERVVFDDCVLAGADLHGARLTAARFPGTDLRGSDWTKSILKDVDLRRARLEDVRGADALRGVTIDRDQVVPLALSLAVALELKIVDDEEE